MERAGGQCGHATWRQDGTKQERPEANGLRECLEGCGKGTVSQ